VVVLRFPQSKPVVLVVNDCPDTLNLLTGALRGAGFLTRAFASAEFRRDGNAGLAGRSPAPDVVVYDIGQGADSDWVSLREFAELPEIERKPLVITTTNVVRLEGHRDAVYLRSDFQFADAPCDPRDLVARVSAAIGLRSMTA
jgi:CheY-like chemotaxis protein